MDKKKKQLIDIKKTEWVLGNLLFLVPAMSYWVSAGLAFTLGADYLYDVVFEQLKADNTGKMYFGLIVVIFPIAAIIINTIEFNKKKKGKWLRGALGMGILLTVAGVLAFWRLFASS